MKRRVDEDMKNSWTGGEAALRMETPEDSLALERLLLSRPYGEHNLRGIRRAAFRQGLL